MGKRAPHDDDDDRTDDDRLNALAAFRLEYRRLADGIADMIKGGRLRESDIPEDMEWLKRQLRLTNTAQRHVGNM